MANCPKCGYRLRLIDYKPECPKCGVNLMYYNMEERLAADADKAEAEHIRMQPRVDRLKAATIGSKYSIARLLLIFVPLGMLFLPLVQVTAQIPFSPINSSVSILTLVSDVVGNMNFDVLTKLFSSELLGTAFICYALAIVFVLLAAVICILNLVFVTLSCSLNNKGIKRNIALSSLGVLFMLGSIICYSVMNSKFSSLFADMYSGKVAFGSFLVILGFLLLIGINVLYVKKGVQVKYKDMSEFIERIGRGSVLSEEELAQQQTEQAAADEKEAAVTSE
ncbi:MAG: hypothetical protein BWY46_00514 [Firmicutes bacterium ADurb.Bin300]|nr:MAG: hypothetical protein BWY46_00514 [Firmicutes bacterium ADurb.Bin300]